MDLSQAEAVADLIASQSKVAHNAAMRQMRGGFSTELKDLREQLIHFAALVELELDFAEEDVEFADRKQMTDLVNQIRKVIERLLASFALGNVIKEGVATVIAGRPNAGKSTLLNALLNEERAIVSEIPGTTRDTIEEILTIRGIRFRLIDTAGIREAGDVIEAMGVKRTMEEIEKSTLLIYVYDAGELQPEAIKQDLAKFENETLKIIVVANKWDKIQKSEEGSQFSHNPIRLSAKEKTNLEALRENLYQSIAGDINLAEQTIVTSARHADALHRANASLHEVETGIQNQISGELFALDIRRALDALGEITGTVSSNDLLGAIFSKFCIGK